MRLTTKARYALRAMVYLASNGRDEGITLVEIAEHQRVKPKYLEQILMKLRRAKLLKSKKGPGGGYFIGRDPGSIKLSEILKAVGESTAPALCAVNKKDKYCSGKKHCPINPYWKKLKKTIDNFFDSYTLADLCIKK